MEKWEILKNDVKVPEIVQKKAEDAFLQIRKEQTMKKTTKKPDMLKRSLAVSAACAAVLAAGVVADVAFNRAADDAQVAENQGNETNAASTENTETKSANPLVMTVYANEAALEEGSVVPIKTREDGIGYAFGGDGEGTYQYCIVMPLYCDGENIESVTYSINKGAFQIIQRNENVVLNGTPYDGIMNAGGIGGPEDDDYTGVTEDYYTEYTVAYGDQQKENVWVNFCSDSVKLSNPDGMWGDDATPESMAQVYAEMVDGVVITCTANYADGTVKSEDVHVGAKVMTFEEAGIAMDDPAQEYAFFVYQLAE